MAKQADNSLLISNQAGLTTMGDGVISTPVEQWIMCRMIPFEGNHQRKQQPGAGRDRRVTHRPYEPIRTEVARMILWRWGCSATHINLDRLEAALALPIAQLELLSASLPRSLAAGVHWGEQGTALTA